MRERKRSKERKEGKETNDPFKDSFLNLGFNRNSKPASVIPNKPLDGRVTGPDREPCCDGDAGLGTDLVTYKNHTTAAMALRAACDRINKMITHTGLERVKAKDFHIASFPGHILMSRRLLCIKLEVLGISSSGSEIRLSNCHELIG